MLSKRQRPYDPASLSASRRLRQNLGDLLARNELPATRIGEVVNDIHGVAPTELRDLVAPISQHTAKKLRRKFLKRSAWMPDYVAELRTWDPKAQKIVKDKVPMQLIHEVVAVLLKFGFRDKLLATDHMDPLTLDHLRHCESEALCKLLGIGLWGDGAPTQWDRSESIDVISLSLPGIGEFQNLRIPLIVMPHSRVCKETWEDVFNIFKWSLTILATGVWPTARHDASPWLQSDKCRVSARPLLRGALVEVRQDWKFAAEVFGFPSHNTAEGCCWACTCKPDEVQGLLQIKIYIGIYIHTHTYIHAYQEWLTPLSGSICIYIYIYINIKRIHISICICSGCIWQCPTPLCVRSVSLEYANKYKHCVFVCLLSWSPRSEK